MDHLNARELAIGLELLLQVAVDEQLMETFGIARVSNVIQLNLHRRSAAARRRRINVAKDPSCAKDYALRTREFHHGDLLPNPPEHLWRNTDVGFRVTAQDKRLGGFIKTT